MCLLLPPNCWNPDENITFPEDTQYLEELRWKIEFSYWDEKPNVFHICNRPTFLVGMNYCLLHRSILKKFSSQSRKDYLLASQCGMTSDFSISKNILEISILKKLTLCLFPSMVDGNIFKWDNTWHLAATSQLRKLVGKLSRMRREMSTEHRDVRFQKLYFDTHKNE